MRSLAGCMLEAIQASDADDLGKLYSAIASIVTLQMPEVDLDAVAGEVKAIEAQYARAREAVERIEKPSSSAIAIISAMSLDL